MVERTSCVVPFCRRTVKTSVLAAKGHNEWICQSHWHLVPVRLKRRKRRLESMLRSNRHEPVRIWPLMAKCWSDAKAAAIETAAGIGGRHGES